MKKLLLLPFFLMTFSMQGQDCVGGAITSHEAYLYGRFETSMRSLGESGVVSSFFLYNADNTNCNWPEENNEIDIEMTGNSENVLFTTHYPNLVYYTDTYDASFNPHADLHDYAIEWEPGIVRWFVDGELVNVQDQDYVAGLIYPMRIFMNLWVSEFESWVGPWDPTVMPAEAEYDYVRFYEYTPGEGEVGTDNNYTFVWEDNFDELNSDRWEVSEFGGFGNNLCSFESPSVEFDNGFLYLQLEEAQTNIPDVPITFTVDLREEALLPSDKINLSGSFNNWCGQCEPMTNTNGVWSITVMLPPGEYEYIFVKNNWEETGKAPLGSACDYNPCDEWNNYGILVAHNAAAINLPAPCWNKCEACDISTPIETPISNKPKQLIATYDILGRPAIDNPHQLLFYFYDDGSVIKK